MPGSLPPFIISIPYISLLYGEYLSWSSVNNHLFCFIIIFCSQRTNVLLSFYLMCCFVSTFLFRNFLHFLAIFFANFISALVYFITQKPAEIHLSLNLRWSDSLFYYNSIIFALCLICGKNLFNKSSVFIFK